MSTNGSILDLDQSEIASVFGQSVDQIKTNKLRFDCCGDWDLNMQIVHSKYFDDRKTLDEAFVYAHSFAKSDPDHKPLKKSNILNSISLKDAFEAIYVRVCVNLSNCLPEICEILNISERDGSNINFF